MKILVTGSKSYIGAVLIDALLADHRVVGYDLADGKDILDREKLKGCIQDVDAIIHLAALSTPEACKGNPELAKELNVEAVKWINEFRGEKPIFFPNTNIGYGTKTKQDIYTEESPMEPNSVYGITKHEGERLIRDHGNYVVLRLASLFGTSPSMRWNLLLNFMVKEAVEKKEIELYEPYARRNFLHVRDIASGFCHVIKNYSKMKNNVYNIGLSEHPTKVEITDMIKRYVPDLVVKAVDGSDPDRRDYVISSRKILSTRWRPMFDIYYGIKELTEVLRG